MGSFLSKDEPSVEVTSQDIAILELKNQRDKLQKYLKQASEIIEREVALSKNFLRMGDRKKAMLCLKKKKYQEKLLVTAEENHFNISKMIDTIEFTLIEHRLFQALRVGNSVLEHLHTAMSVEDVENLMDETTENFERQQEIDDLLSEKLTDADELDLLEELEQLVREKEEQEKLDLPRVPSTRLVSPGETIDTSVVHSPKGNARVAGYG